MKNSSHLVFENKVVAEKSASSAAPTCSLILVSGKGQAEISAEGLDNQRQGATSNEHLRHQVI